VSRRCQISSASKTSRASRRASAVLAGLAYAVVVFAVGFAFGTVRVLLLAPRTGELAAVAIEAPLMLLASWLLCARIVRWAGLPPARLARATMGAVALAALLVLELVVSIAILGRTPAAHLAGYGTPAGLLGLAAQLVFAAFPLLHGLAARRAG
jgi:hypothetical protein